MTRRFMLYFAVPLLLVLPASSASLLRMKGSENMQQFGQRLTAWYSSKHPEIGFQVGVEQTANSFAAMANGQLEIVQSSRKVLHAEEEALRAAKGKNYLELQVATEIAGIAVNQSNPVKELSLFQLRQVLSGKAKNWKQVGGPDAPVTIYGRDDASGVRGLLEDEFMGDEFISASAQKFGNNSGVIAALSRDANGIAFTTVDRNVDPKVRYLAIKQSTNGVAVAPTGDAIRERRYTLLRPLYFYFAGAPHGDLLRFAEWILSPEGQLVVESVGFYPLSAAEREAGRQALQPAN